MNITDLKIDHLAKYLKNFGVQLEYLPKCHSTMDPVNKYDSTLSETSPNNLQDYIVITDNQTGGIGRSGSSWRSEPKSDLIFTLHKLMRANTLKSMPQNLSVAIGLCVLQVLKSNFDIPVKFKWPNDIYLNNMKLCGILIHSSNAETSAESISAGLAVRVRVGIGINVNSNPNNYISLNQFIGNSIDRSKLFYNIIDRILAHLNDLENNLVQNLDLNPQDDYLFDKKIRFYSGEKIISGLYAGYSSDGILIKKSEYETICYSSASNIEII